MSEFLTYLTESTKEYDYKIKVAGELDDNFAGKLETACQKFEVKKLSSGKKTPIQEMPLDFPSLKNIEVTIYELKTAYPVSAHELREYLAHYLNLAKNQIVVKKPGEPTEEYQEEMKEPSPFVAKLQDIEYGDAPKVKTEEHYGDKYNMSLLKELLKNRKEITHAEEDTKNKDEKKLQDREEKGTASPLKPAHKGPVKGNPHPAKGK
jgi:hypothetical protein